MNGQPLTFARAAEILGPQTCGHIDAVAAAFPPLRPDQIAQLVPLLTADDPAGDVQTADVA